MNRYVTDGLLADMREGKSVLVIAGSRYEAQYVHHAVVESANLAGLRVLRANGREAIVAPGGGRIDFRSVGAGVRGYAPDVAVLTGGATGALGENPRLRDDVWPLLYRAEVIGI